MFMICIVITFVIIFIDFSKNSNNYNVDVYKIYYVYDELSSPTTLSYDMLEVDVGTKKEDVVNRVIDKYKEKGINISSVRVENNIIYLNIENEEYNRVLIESLIDIDGIDTININGVDYGSKISEYYVNSPIVDKLHTFLYKDENYEIVYLNELESEVLFRIKSSTKDEMVYYLGEREIKLSVKRDGLYLDDKKVLSKDFKVNNDGVSEVKLMEDNTLMVVIDNDLEKIILKQGIGIYYMEDKENKTVLSYKDKRFYER